MLHKPGKLDEAEFTHMKTHVNQGMDIIERASWLKDASLVLGHHHEKVDGTGYPLGRKGEEIPIAARIFAIVDVFDALTSKRPYKDPFSLEKTLLILAEGRGRHFDEKILDEFFALAPALHQKYAGREDEAIRKELMSEVAAWFSGSPEDLTP